ncbi:hypothetical protein Tco_1563997 [Tanacetum coccineum]
MFNPTIPKVDHTSTWHILKSLDSSLALSISLWMVRNTHIQASTQSLLKKMLQRIFMNEICCVFLQFLLKYIFDFGIKITINNCWNLGLENIKSFRREINTVMMVGASVVIGGVGIGVGVYCTVEDWLSFESIIRESFVLMETGSGEFRVGWEYPAKN